eukprot:661754-Hanusia_phi.AAC.2
MGMNMTEMTYGDVNHGDDGDVFGGGDGGKLKRGDIRIAQGQDGRHATDANKSTERKLRHVSADRSQDKTGHNILLPQANVHSLKYGRRNAKSFKIRSREYLQESLQMKTNKENDWNRCKLETKSKMSHERHGEENISRLY